MASGEEDDRSSSRFPPLARLLRLSATQCEALLLALGFSQFQSDNCTHGLRVRSPLPASPARDLSRATE